MQSENMMRFDVPAAPMRILQLLNDAGYEAYLVGGCVRDAVRGATPHDYDITTNALPEEMLSVFSGLRTIETGLRHGTLTVLLDGEPFEVTTYRVDGTYEDHRRPESVTFTNSVLEDLRRRDFTVNAMAYHPKTGLCDPFGGVSDLTDGIIRAVGIPSDRFAEDALRILRALRFSARFGFQIEEETIRAARALKGTLTFIAAERVREELAGILLAPYADRILLEYADILATVIPEGSTAIPLAGLDPNDLPLRLAAYLHTAGSQAARAALWRLRNDRATCRAVEDVLMLREEGLPRGDVGILHALRKYGREGVARAIALASAEGKDVSETKAQLDALLREGACYMISMLAVDGKDLAAIGIPCGREMGATLERLLEAVIRKECPNEREALLAYAKIK